MLALAQSMYGKHVKAMTLSLNASDDRGIDVVRRQIQDFASTRRLGSDDGPAFSLIILDECDAMTREAQMALRRVIEKYAKRTRFALICNQVSRLIPAIQSRCTRFRFAPLPVDCALARVKEVAAAENVELTDGGASALVKLSQGDMRRVLNTLQSAHLAHAKVDEEAVYATTGAPRPVDTERAMKSLLNASVSEAVKDIRHLQEARGISLLDLVRELLPYTMRIQGVPSGARARCLANLADTEHRISLGCAEKTQIGGVVAAFVELRDELVAVAQ